MRLRCALGAALLLSVAPVAYGVDGVYEINESCAVNTGCFPGDLAGYPVTLFEGASYVLTSNLEPSDQATSAIQLFTSDISLDLNGFAIRFPDGPGGAGRGIDGVNAQNSTVRNGSVLFAGSDAVRLGNGARVEGLTIERPNGAGIFVAGSSIIRNNGVGHSGAEGIRTSFGAQITDNRVIFAGRVAQTVPESSGIRTRTASRVVGNVVRLSTGGHGIAGIDDSGLDEGRLFVAGNVVEQNGVDGIRVGSGSTVEGNSATGNGGQGILAGDGCRIADNVVFQNAFGGVQTDDRSLVSENAVSENGGSDALVLGVDTSFVHNTVDGAVNGGVNRGKRRFYLTVDGVDGAAPLTACESGFHMASWAEISDPSNLVYDTTRGQSSADSGLEAVSATPGRRFALIVRSLRQPVERLVQRDSFTSRQSFDLAPGRGIEPDRHSGVPCHAGNLGRAEISRVIARIGQLQPARHEVLTRRRIESRYGLAPPAFDGNSSESTLTCS